MTPAPKVSIPSPKKDLGGVGGDGTSIATGVSPWTGVWHKFMNHCVCLYLTTQSSLECGGLTPLSFADGVRACRSPRIDSRLRFAGKQSGAPSTWRSRDAGTGAPHRRGTRGLDPSSPPQRAAEIKSGVEPPHSTDRSRSATRNLSRSNRKLSNADLCQTPGPGREPVAWSLAEVYGR